MRPRFYLPLLAFAAFVLPLAASPQQVPPDHAERLAKGTELFKQSVRGILTQRCLNCHGGEKTRGDFDLSTRETLLRGVGPERVVIPFDHKKSRLFQQIAHMEKPFMPHKLDKLPDKEIALIAQWIDLGAPYDKPLVDKIAAGKKPPMVVTDKDRQYWAFQPLKRTAPPSVKDAAWCKTAVDRFILAKLDEKGLTTNPALDRRQLIRRVYFDVIGLPPTPDEVDAFVNDPDPDAYPKLLDRLLDSPHFGEKWARHWLDLARFAESSGYEHDYDRPFAYHYRDFVIKAFNQDLPFNTFVKWQLAGDEYEPDNPLAMMATGFLAAGTHSTQITKNLVEKERYEQLDDKLRTVGTAMLGLTVGCARCHDHKYDPIPTRDYYRMLATFTTTVKANVDVALDPAAHKKALAAWEQELAKRLAPLKDFERDEMPARFELWLRDTPKPTPQPMWVILDLQNPKSQGGATFTAQDDGSVLAGGKEVDNDTYTFTAKTSLKGITALRLEALADDSLPKRGPGRADNGNFAVTNIRVTATNSGKAVPVKLVNPRATFEQKGLAVASALTGDKKTGWAVSPRVGEDHAAVFDLETPLAGEGEGETLLTITLEFKNNKKHAIGRSRLSVTTQPRPAPLDGETTPEKVLRTLDQRNGPLSAAQKAVLLPWYRTLDRQWQRLLADVADHKRTMPRPQLAKVLVASEGVPPLRMHSQGADFFEQTFFLNRGDVDQKIGIAPQGFLQVLTRHPDQEKHWQIAPPLNVKTSYRRRALAEWMTDVDNGAGQLLARVIVNRLWQHHFGRGLVNTPSDFGVQGEAPSHPELLDYLAQELINNGWRLKAIHKLLMTSAAYTQSSDANAAGIKADPENQWLWHRPRQRLQAELIRDAMLAVSGQLDPHPFGPGTLDPNQKRRSIYFFVKRSKMVPSMVLFDAPDALGGTDKRPTTTVAPQALLVMNSEMVRGYAEGLAKRIGTTEPAEAVRQGYRIALGRAPTARESKMAVAFLEQQTASYSSNGRQLALADLCQVLLGLNEFIYID